ncbi:MAG: glycosyltransferase family 4 protein [Planctomycetota bacterium]|nr:MAG: glycosyltransferase family 4 protein [Planctomycetota bacterium]
MAVRVALVIHALYGGGAERLMSRLAGRWSDRHSVHLVTWANTDSDRYSVPPAVTRHGLGLMGDSPNWVAGVWANLRRVRRLRNKLQEVRPDAVISFTDQVNIVTLQATSGWSAPVWIAEHSDPRQQRLRPAWERWRNRVYPRAAGCIVLTESIAEYARRWLPAERIRVIPAAVDDLPQGVRTSVEAHPPRFLFVGRLSAEKRVDRLIAAWQRIAPRLEQWRLTVVGDGPLRAQLEAAAAEVPRVEFLGWHDAPEQVYREGGVLVLPSQYEGFPVALLEGMLHGLPAIATQCTDAVQTLAGSGDALVVVPQDVDALAQAMCDLANDPCRRAVVAERGSAVASKYQWQHVGPLWDAVLDQSASLNR